jgi:hypothetical protein
VSLSPERELAEAWRELSGVGQAVLILMTVREWVEEQIIGRPPRKWVIVRNRMEPMIIGDARQVERSRPVIGRRWTDKEF